MGQPLEQPDLHRRVETPTRRQDVGAKVNMLKPEPVESFMSKKTTTICEGEQAYLTIKN